MLGKNLHILFIFPTLPLACYDNQADVYFAKGKNMAQMFVLQRGRNLARVVCMALTLPLVPATIFHFL